MDESIDQDPRPYIELKQKGASPQEVFKQAKKDGFKNFECIALISGVFDLELHEAREIAHKLHKR